jgi:hypothetical protein
MTTDELARRVHAIFKDYTASNEAYRKEWDKLAPIACDVKAQGEALNAEVKRRLASNVRVTTAASSFETRQAAAVAETLQFSQQALDMQGRRCESLAAVSGSAMLAMVELLEALGAAQAREKAAADAAEAAAKAAAEHPRWSRTSQPSWR